MSLFSEGGRPKIARLYLEITLQYKISQKQMLLLFEELLLFEVNCLDFFHRGNRENCFYSRVACIRGFKVSSTSCFQPCSLKICFRIHRIFRNFLSSLKAIWSSSFSFSFYPSFHLVFFVFAIIGFNFLIGDRRSPNINIKSNGSLSRYCNFHIPCFPLNEVK